MSVKSIDKRLYDMGITLPEPAAPVASYVATVEHGGLLHISGQLPFVDGQIVKGRLGESVTLDDGVNAARACGIMILAQAKAALGSLERVERVVKLGGFVNSTGDFVDQPKVVNGASARMAAMPAAPSASPSYHSAPRSRWMRFSR